MQVWDSGLQCSLCSGCTKVSGIDQKSHLVSFSLLAGAQPESTIDPFISSSRIQMHPLFIQSLISAFPHAVHLQWTSLPNTPFPHCSFLLSMSQPKRHLLRTTFPVHNSVLYHYTQTSSTSQQGHRCGYYFPVSLLVYCLR